MIIEIRETVSEQELSEINNMISKSFGTSFSESVENFEEYSFISDIYIAKKNGVVVGVLDIIIDTKEVIQLKSIEKGCGSALIEAVKKDNDSFHLYSLSSVSGFYYKCGLKSDNSYFFEYEKQTKTKD